MEKLQERLKTTIVMPDVTKIVKMPVKPDWRSILVAKAVVFVLLDRGYRHLLPLDVLETQLQFLYHVLDPEKLKRKYQNLGYRKSLMRWEAKTFPGLIAHIVLRKRRIEEITRQAIIDGFRQIVSFGSGFDTLLPRIAHQFPNVTCIELDLAPNLKAKRAVLRRPPANLHFVDCNLQEPTLKKIMLELGHYDKSQKTLFIAEGVLMFLDDDDVERIFGFMMDYAAQGSRFAFTFLERGPDNKAYYPEQGFLTDIILRARRIKFGWGVRQEHIVQYLNDRYFGTLEVLSAQDLRERAPAPIPPAAKRYTKVEYMAVGELVFTE